MPNIFTASGLCAVQYFKANYETAVLSSHDKILIFTVMNQYNFLKLIVITF